MSATQEIAGWIRAANVRSFVRLLAILIRYNFDDWDWDAIAAGLASTDNKDPHSWLTYPLVGTPELELLLANNPGSDVVSVRIRGPEDQILKARIETLLMALSELKVVDPE